MKTMSKFLLVTMILFMVGLGCVSAADVSDNNGTSHTIQKDTSQSTYTIQSTSNSNNTISNTHNIKTSVNKKENIKTSNNKITKKSTNKTLKKSSYTITSDNYNLYFKYNKTQNKTKSTNLVQAGDTIDLQGTFTNMNFSIDKSNITLTSTNKNAKLYNCTVNVEGLNSTGAVIKNLTITNNNYYGSGIYVNKTKNITITNNHIHVWGPFAFALAADQMNNSRVYDNYFQTSCREDMNRTHTAAAFGLCYYNNIDNNTVVSDQANGIYFSVYGSGLFQGGYCDYNNVTGNYVTGGDTSWSYTIQIMGTENTIRNNYVKEGYRGISTQDFTNNYIIGNEVNATAEGIYACEGAIVSNNIVHVNTTTVGITIGGEGVLLNNNTVTSNSGSCIRIMAGKAIITNNTLWSTLGNGIYAKGAYKNITISNNNITSGKIGIVFKKQSSSKKINYVNVTNNRIQSYDEYAIDFSEAGARNEEDAHVYVAESNVLNCTSGQGLDLAYLPPSSGTSENLPDSNKTYIITEDNYYTYFTDEYTVNTNKVLKNDTLILQGTFTNKNFTFPIKVHIIGQNCTIYNGTVTFTGDAHASSITNVTIINNRHDSSVINVHAIEVVEVNNCNITNVKINNYDKWESFGIFLYSSSGNTVTHNTIFTSGDYVNYAIFVYASDLNNITNNIVRLNQSNIPIEYDSEIMFDDRIGAVQEVLHNYGIILLYSSYNTINKNDVNVTSQFDKYQFPVDTCKNSVVGIDVYYDSNYNFITNNKITVNSYGPYEYGMGVLGAPWGSSISSLNATNNTFRNNNVVVNGGYFATGFIAGLNSVNTIVENNTFNVNALHNSTVRGDYAYGLTLEHCLNTTFINNKMNASAASLYTIELFDTDNNKIINNTFYGEATNPYGVAGYESSFNRIIGNNITMRGADYGNTSSALHSDAIPFGKNGIMFMTRSFSNTVINNTIDNNASPYAVNLTSDTVNNTITENSIRSSQYIGDNAVLNDHKSNNVSHNFLYFTNITVTHVKGTVGHPVTFTANINSTTDDLKNLTVVFRIGTTIIGSSNVTNGVATIRFNDTNLLKPTIYTIIASVSGTNFQNATNTNSLNLNKTKTSSIVNVNNVPGLPGSTVTINAEIKDNYDAQLTGNATFILDGKTLGTTNVTLGKASYTYRIPANAESKAYNITVVYSGNDDYFASNGTAKLYVQTKSVATVSSETGIIGNQVTITSRFTANGKAITSGTVTIYVNNSLVGTAKVSNGVATYKYTIPSTLVAGKYPLNVTFDGTNLLTKSTAHNNITVNKAASTISYTSTHVRVGEPTTLNIIISDKAKTFNGNSGRVTLMINGKDLKYTNGTVISATVNKNGTARFKFTAPSTLLGKNNITIKYYGNNQLNSSTSTYKNGLVIYTGQVYYVATNGTSKNDGRTPETPWNYTYAFDTIKNSKYNNSTLYILNGVYKINKTVTFNTNVNLKIIGYDNVVFDGNNKKISNFNIQNGLISIEDITFTGFKNTPIINRAPKTTISGNTFINNKGSNGGAISNYNANNALITGNVFQNNTASYGGAIYNRGNNTIITNNQFTKNNATISSGAIYNLGANTKVTNNQFTNNTAKTLGGAINNWDTKNTVIIDNKFNGNKANYGGSIYYRGSTLKLDKNNMTSNTAIVSGGAVFVIGQNNNITNNNFTQNKAKTGAVINNLGTNINIKSNIMQYNTATSLGGAISNWNAKYIIITGNRIHHNQAQYGAIYLRGTNITVQSNNIYNNKATSSGGAIYNIGTNNTITENTIKNNDAKSYGGAINNYNAVNTKITNNNLTSNNASYGGAIYTRATNTTITGNKITSNTANSGGAIFDMKHATTTINHNTIKNNPTKNGHEEVY